MQGRRQAAGKTKSLRPLKKGRRHKTPRYHPYFCKNRSPYSPAAGNGAVRQSLQTECVQDCRSKGNFTLTRAQVCFQPGTHPLCSPWKRLLSFFIALYSAILSRPAANYNPDKAESGAFFRIFSSFSRCSAVFWPAFPVFAPVFFPVFYRNKWCVP